MRKLLMLEEEKDDKLEKLVEKISPISKFKLSFLNENARIHQVEVRNINFQDLMRHLQHGESVIITPEFPGNYTILTKKQEEKAPWYFVHL
jgi:hypothetical protein